MTEEITFRYAKKVTTEADDKTIRVITKGTDPLDEDIEIELKLIFNQGHIPDRWKQTVGDVKGDTCTASLVPKRIQSKLPE